MITTTSLTTAPQLTNTKITAKLPSTTKTNEPVTPVITTIPVFSTNIANVTPSPSSKSQTTALLSTASNVKTTDTFLESTMTFKTTDTHSISSDATVEQPTTLNIFTTLLFITFQTSVAISPSARFSTT